MHPVLIGAAVAFLMAGPEGGDGPPPPAGTLIRGAAAVGATPATLAASGFSVAQAGTMVHRLAESDQQIAAVDAAGEAAAQRAADLTACQEAVLRRPWDQQARAALAAAAADLDQARAQAAAARTGLRTLVLEGMPAQAVERLRCTRAGCASGQLPPQYQVLPLSEEQDAGLCRALTAAARAQRRGEPAPTWASTLIAEARGQSAVIEAEGWLASRLPQIRSLFGQ